MRRACPRECAVGRRPYHCFLRQPWQIVRRKRCCVAVSPMTAPALPEESSANQHAGFQLEMQIRPESRCCRYPVLTNPAPGAVPQHGGASLVLLAPRNSLAQRCLRLADMKRRLRGKKMFVLSLCTTEVFPCAAEHS